MQIATFRLLVRSIDAKCANLAVLQSLTLNNYSELLPLSRQIRHVAVVPSAPGKRFADDTKITDLLYLAQELGSKGVSIDSAWSKVVERFVSLVADLGIDCPLDAVLADIATQLLKAQAQITLLAAVKRLMVAW